MILLPFASILQPLSSAGYAFPPQNGAIIRQCSTNLGAGFSGHPSCSLLSQDKG